MKANYHTHTARCGHAQGTDEEYVLAAIGQGFDALGFSDHMPWPYASGYTHPHVRMHVNQMDEYLLSIRHLKEKYADKIRVLAGFECEFFPDYMSWLADMKQEKGIDYLIFGNHYHHSDETGVYFGNSKSAADISLYVDSAMKGIDSGLFAYMAHPDLFMRRYGQFDENCRAAAKDLCQACKAKNLPMEYNLHDRFWQGESHRGYPHPDFFEIAADEGVRVIIGIDAHEPVEIADPTQWNRAVCELERFGIDRLEALILP